MQVILIKDDVICDWLGIPRCFVSHLPVIRPGCWQGQAGSVRTVAVDPTAGVHLGLYLHVNSHGERVSAKHLALTRHLEAASDNCWASQPRSQGGNAWQLPGHGSLGPAARPRLKTVAGGFMEMLMRSTC